MGNIYRFKEITRELIKVPSNWKYNGGEINGDYTYNVNQELIVAVAEQTEGKDIPLKTINLNVSKDTDIDSMYHICPTLPQYRMDFNGFTNGQTIANGTYTFFIRFEISNETWTNWFNIGIPILIGNPERRTVIEHKFTPDTANTGFAEIKDLNLREKFTTLNPKFTIILNDVESYQRYQIGYILNVDNSAVARTWRTYDVEGAYTINNSIVFDATNPEEYGIDNMLKHTFNIFNVGLVENYENRLYIADYKESQANIDFRTYAKDVKVTYELKSIPTLETTITSEAKIKLLSNWATTELSFTYTNGYIEYPVYYFNSQNTYKDLWRVSYEITDIEGIMKFLYNSNWGLPFTNLANYYIRVGQTEKYVALTTCVGIVYTDYSYGAPPQRFRVVYKNSNGNYETLETVSSGYVFDIFTYTNGNYVKSHSGANAAWRNIRIQTLSEQVDNTNNFVKGTGFINQTLNNRTLLPNQVYNFFIHYVRKDGTMTNGIRLNNDTNTNVVINAIDDTIPDLPVLANIVDIRNSLGIIIAEHGTTINQNLVRFYNGGLSAYKLFNLINNANYESKYNFGYYENSKGESMFKAPDINGKPDQRIVPVFNNIIIPEGYVGVFFSYEQIEDNVCYSGLAYRYAKTSGISATSKYNIQATDVISRNLNFNGAIINRMCGYNHNTPIDGTSGYFIPTVMYVNSYDTVPRSTKFDVIKDSTLVLSDDPDGFRSGLEYNIQVTTNSTDFPTDIRAIVQILLLNEHLYLSDDKVLMPLTGIYYKFTSENAQTIVSKINEDIIGLFNCNSFIAHDSAIQFSPYGVLIHADGLASMDVSLRGQSDTWHKSGSYAIAYPYWKYSKFNTSLREYNIAPEKITTVLNISGSYTDALNINYIVRPFNQAELYKLPNDYDLIPQKQYANVDYKRLDILRYRKVIRRSNIIQSESLENSWRRFEADAYKVVVENKGDVTNLVGVGKYLLFHTEHSLFAFDKSNQLITEEMKVQLNQPDPFDIGYTEIITSDKGYAGLQDKYAWNLNEFGYFFYDNDGKHVYNFDNNDFKIVDLELSEFIFRHDIDKMRFGYDFKNKRLMLSSILDKETFTISYNMYTKNWISLHDYQFSKSYAAKTSLYYPNPSNTLLYIYADADFGDYKELKTQTAIYPVYSMGNKRKSYFDIICNFNYEILKTLEAISYICSEMIEFKPPVEEGSAEVDMNRFYSGDELFIYSDTCRTKLMDINVNNYPSRHHAAPFYDRGVWNFNWFRNSIIPSSKSDNLSLLYGKYIVARFIIDHSRSLPVKFENVTFYISNPLNV